MKYYVYMLESIKGRHYIGITTDPDRRLIEHNGGSTRSTRPFRPWKMIYTEALDTRSEACKREWYLKHTAGHHEKQEIIKIYGGKSRRIRHKDEAGVPASASRNAGHS